MRTRHSYLFLVPLLLAPFAWRSIPASDPEVARVQRHIARAERSAATHDVRGLSTSQRAARARDLAILERYRRAGLFPHNHDFPASRVPYFRDQHGTLCAMAYLVAQSGGLDLVEAVARRMNNATILQMAADRVIGPALEEWLRGQGLTLAEAQAIQPHYGYEPPEETVPPEYAAASAACGTLNLLALASNEGAFGKPSRTASSVGVFTGFVGVGLGVGYLATHHDPSVTLGMANTFVGAIAMISSLSSLTQAAHEEAAQTSSSMRLAPICGLDGRAHPFAGVAAVF